jgi:hypothetical protein
MKTLALLLALALSGAISGLAHAQDPQAGCLADRYGNVVCGPADSRCLKDLYGDVKCSSAGGDIMLDRYKTPVCGAGRCILDRYGDVVCSRVARGAAAIDIHGDAVCTEGCMKATSAACVAPST